MKVISSEKAVRLLEIENILVVETDRRISKKDIKKEIEEMFNVKIESVNVLIRDNKKFAYVKLNKANPAIDVATKLGMI